jgi:hypothetical protein
MHAFLYCLITCAFGGFVTYKDAEKECDEAEGALPSSRLHDNNFFVHDTKSKKRDV